MLSSAAEIEQERIQVTDEERGTFKDKRLDPNNQGCWYCLSFGDDETMPHCECPDWEKHPHSLQTLLSCVSILQRLGSQLLTSMRERKVRYQKTRFVAIVRFPMKSLQNLPTDRNHVEHKVQSTKKP